MGLSSARRCGFARRVDLDASALRGGETWSADFFTARMADYDGSSYSAGNAVVRAAIDPALSVIL